jgi:ferric-dicitrate binding protein FerR (iron transport regulator)
MSYNRFLQLLLKKRSGELFPDEQAELEDFLTSNPGYYELSDLVDQVYDTPLNKVKGLSKAYLRKRWNALKKRTYKINEPGDNYGKTRAFRPLKYYYIAAASVAAVIFLNILILSYQRKFAAKDVIVATKMGSKTSMTLPDGSTVWLNAGSKISYGKDFGKASRSVRLSGEAFFDVIDDSKCPFIVNTANFDIKVLGTAFNVNAYLTDNKSEAVVVRGLIEVSLKDKDSRKLLLAPHEKFIFKRTDNMDKGSNSGQSMNEIIITKPEKPFKDSATVETQWLHDCLAFRDDKLKDIALMISRWYGVSVEIKDKQLEEKKFSGLFKDESVEMVMHALQLAGGFHYTIDKNKITIIP